MTEREVLANRTLYMFNKKNGKLVKSASGMGRGMLGMYGLQNTTKSRISILVFDEDNVIERIYIGREGCPKVIYLDKMDYEETSLDEFILDEQHIDMDWLKGLLNLLGD